MFKNLTNSQEPNTSWHRPERSIFRYLGRFTSFVMTLAIALVFGSTMAFSQAVNFESPTYTLGNINGQDGWSKTGPYDAVVSASSVPGFGSQSLRISNAITSGSFGDQTFSKSNPNESGETSAANGGLSGGTRKNKFITEWQFTSTVPGAEQPGLSVVASPDRGDGARMSWVQMRDLPGGIQINFFDYQAALGNTCASGLNFVQTNLVSGLSRSAVHTIRIEMDFVDGVQNDVVRVYVNGVLEHTGTSWEDYFRNCEGNPTRTVDSVLFRVGGTAAPATSGNGFFIDNLGVFVPQTLVVDDDSACLGASFTSITSAIAAASPNDTVSVCPGTYNENPAINKSLTVQSTGGRLVTTIQLSAANSIFLGGAGSDIKIDGFTVRGVDGTPTTIGNVNIQVVNALGARVTISNNRILVGKRDFSPDGDDSIGILTYTGGSPINTSLTVTNNIFNSVTPGAVLNRAFYVNPSTSSFVFQDNEINGDFTSSGASEADTTLIDNNVVNGTGTSYGFSVNNGGMFPSYVGSTITRNFISNTLRAFSVGTYTSASNASVRSNSFLNNVLGVRITPNSSVSSLTFNRIVGSSVAGILNQSVGTVNAENNWWGCNYGPAATGAGCTGTTNGFTGPVDANPWLRLTTSAATPSVLVGGSDLVTSLLTTNSDGNTPGGGFIRNGTPASFVGTFGTVAPPANTTTSGSTSTTFTGTTQGAGGVATTIDGQTVSAPITVYNASCAAISIPTAIPTLRGQAVTVPINSDLLTGRNALGFVTTINYDSTKLGFNGISNAGTLTSGFTYTVDSSVLGTLQIFGFGAAPLSGSGVLLNLSFQANGTISAVPTPITFASFSFNEGNPCSTTTDGSVTIISGDISGRVTFALNGSHGVPNVAMNATGTSPAVTTNTDYTPGTPPTWGNYTLTGFGSGPYTVTPAKAPQPAQSGPTINGITPSDSACIALWGVGQTCVTTASATTAVPLLGSARFRAADVTKNGTLSPLDASYIAQFSVNTPNPGFAGTWEFIAASTLYSQAQIETGLTGQNYTAILLGDVTGNWNPAIAGGNRPAPVDPESQKDAVTAAAADLRAAPGASVTVPVSISNLAGRGVTAYQFDVIYDPRVLETLETAAGLAGTVSDGMSVVFNRTEPGRLRVAVYGATSVAGDGTLIDLHFRAIGAVGTASVLSIDSLVLNEGGIAILTRNGQVSVAAAEQGTIRGKLLTASGQGVVNARVNLTSTTGEKRSVVSSSFGGFEFGGLTTGETYTVTVNSKRFTFSPRTVSVVDAVTVLDIIAEQ